MLATDVPVEEKLKFFLNLAKEWNAKAVKYSNSVQLSRLQSAATQLLSPAYSLAFGIEALLSARHLFAAELLLRPLIERVAVLNYLAEEGDQALDIWDSGWDKNKRPSLPELIEYVPVLQDRPSEPDGSMTMKEFRQRTLNRLHALVHADPLGSLRCLAPAESDHVMISGPMVGNQIRFNEVAIHTVIFVSALLKVTERVFPCAEWPYERTAAKGAEYA